MAIEMFETISAPFNSLPTVKTMGYGKRLIRIFVSGKVMGQDMVQSAATNLKLSLART